jgi:thiamine-phosphate pyrophosphorylase
MALSPGERHPRLAAARLYFVCDSRPHGADPGPLLEAALSGGVEMLELRDKALDDEALLDATRPFREAAERHGVPFILNDRPDLVRESGADGVHLGQDDTPVDRARAELGPERLIGLSTHSAQQFAAAGSAPPDARPDYISVGPIWETPTKAGRPATGLELVARAAREATLPWFAIGGIDPSNVGEVVAAGGERVVVVRAIRDADDPAGATRALRDAVEAATEARR